MKYLATLAIALLPTIVLAHDYQIGDLSVAHPIARAATETAMTSAGYFEVTNTGETADTLLAVEAEFPRVMMHDTVMDGDIAKMEHMMSVPIEPGETVTFAPGGKHVMFMGLKDVALEIGQDVPAVMVFENAGRLDIVFKVEEIVVDHANH